MHLLQIIGGQPWPNFLPLLSLKPSKVTFLTSADTKGNFKKSIEALEDAAGELNCDFEIEIIATESKEPTIKECSETLELKLSELPDIINITGGTKPMGIAAYLLAQKHTIPSFYLDTRRPHSEAFELTKTSNENINFIPLDELASKINVRLALMAQGFPVPNSFKTPNPQELRFATLAANLRKDPEANKEIGSYICHTIRKQLINPDRNKLYEKGKLRKALQTPFSAPIDSATYKYLLAATECGLMTQLDDKTLFRLTTLDLEKEGSKKLRSIADYNFKLLEGLWFELALIEHLKKNAEFSDICWSVEADGENADSIGETDLVAFNSKTLTLHFISCKVTGPHGQALDHIQGLRRRATKEGGKFSKADLWIFAPKSEESKNSLKKHCKEQNVQLRILSEELTANE